MKTKRISVIIAALLMILTALPMGAFAAERAVVEDSKASIKVENAVTGDELVAYKIINITYDADTNHLTYAWNGNFADYFEGTTAFNSTVTTVEQFEELESNSDKLIALIAQLPNYIADRDIQPVDAEIVAADGKATFADLAMGEYFIRPTSSTSVYQLMLQKIEPYVVNGTYVIDDIVFDAKKQEVTITKTADKTSVTKGGEVAYTVTVDIPTYSDNATDKSFYVSDLLPDGLTLHTNSIKVQIDDADVDRSAYTLDKTATAEYTFKLSVDSDKYAASWSPNGGKRLVITYNATFNNDDTTAVNAPEINTATFDYSYYPYYANSHNQKIDTATVTTFAIKIDKYAKQADENDTSVKLAGAKFDLYRTALDGETSTVKIPHTDIDGVLLEDNKDTDNNGVATFEKYEANGENYDYYLVETQAPSGYNLLNSAIKVNFIDTEVVTKEGVYTVKVPNSSGIELPITGGMGTVIFSVLGITLMGGALSAFLIMRKRHKARENG